MNLEDSGRLQWYLKWKSIVSTKTYSKRDFSASKSSLQMESKLSMDWSKDVFNRLESIGNRCERKMILYFSEKTLKEGIQFSTFPFWMIISFPMVWSTFRRVAPFQSSCTFMKRCTFMKGTLFWTITSLLKQHLDDYIYLLNSQIFYMNFLNFYYSSSYTFKLFSCDLLSLSEFEVQRI